MKSVNPFAFQSYKSVMKSYFREGSRGALSRAAEALNCQRSFLSRIMNSKMQITPDLAYRLCKHWQFTLAEREYFLALVDWERAGDPELREYLRGKLRQLKESHESSRKQAQRPMVVGEEMLEYFSSWHWTAIHFLCAVPEFQTVDSIGAQLQLPAKLVRHCLVALEARGYLRRAGNRWEYAGGEYHLPKNSPLVILHHQNWRHKAVLSSQEIHPSSIHYTNIHTISKANIPVLREKILQFIAEANSTLKNSKEEACIAFLVDFFTV